MPHKILCRIPGLILHKISVGATLNPKRCGIYSAAWTIYIFWSIIPKKLIVTQKILCRVLGLRLHKISVDATVWQSDTQSVVAFIQQHGRCIFSKYHMIVLYLQYLQLRYCTNIFVQGSRSERRNNSIGILYPKRCGICAVARQNIFTIFSLWTLRCSRILRRMLGWWGGSMVPDTLWHSTMPWAFWFWEVLWWTLELVVVFWAQAVIWFFCDPAIPHGYEWASQATKSNGRPPAEGHQTRSRLEGSSGCALERTRQAVWSMDVAWLFSWAEVYFVSSGFLLFAARGRRDFIQNQLRASIIKEHQSFDRYVEKVLSTEVRFFVSCCRSAALSWFFLPQRQILQPFGNGLTNTFQKVSWSVDLILKMFRFRSGSMQISFDGFVCSFSGTMHSFSILWWTQVLCRNGLQ